MSWYSTPTWTTSPRHIVSAAVVATDDEARILLIRSPHRGWEMPGGQVELGETLEAAAIRETKEESGFDVGQLVFCGVFQTTDRSIVNVLFRGRVTGGAPRPGAEALEIGFFAPHEALAVVSHANFRDRIAYCLDQATQPFCIAT